MENQNCQIKPLAVSDLDNIITCSDCGQVHLVLQNVTPDFDVQALSNLTGLLDLNCP